MRTSLFVSLLALVLNSAPISAQDAVRIDSTTVASAEASWKNMSDSLRGKKQEELHLAMLKLNMVGVKSAHEAIDNPELQEVGIARIKDKVSGMSADEIIDLASRTSTLTVESEAK